MVICTGKDRGDAFKGCGNEFHKYGNVTYKLCPKCNAKRLRGKSEPKKATGQAVLFDEIWNETPHRSFLSDKPLGCFEGTDMYYNLFAHVLSKALNKYPKYMLNKENIVLLHPDEHTLFDHGSEEQREKYAKENDCSWLPLYELREKLIKQYKNEH